ncbi:SDR family oxidoreductase [Oceanicella actignis]|uniref:Citronellol/citronellal dehydrogenase n=1 Tax=Oceanicella actignis TaxID=1189325 RepID=A0A1M7SSC1_9RHOB|nr:NAD(P)-dependent oxidoreductase [Oceanicella actignis]SES68458.1 citronellol/citronellal dehydrogenase [Oceanicella actignis]SHN61318.1 citronellol/citronellal dehydrogenase [Oceanicella actignis]
MGALSGRTVFMSGGSRGIGLAIAKACAAQGANVAIAAKTAEPNPKLPGTVYTAAEEIEAAGGKALPLICDIRDEAQVLDAVEKTASAFGGIDIVVNNASAIQLTNTEMTEVKRYDLMTGINSRGTFVVTRSCLPHLKKSDHARILTLSPPLDFNPIWFRGHAAYSLAKYGMSILTMAWSEEFKGRIAANCLWPRTTIDTAAVRNLLGGEKMASESRTPQIMGDAAAAMLAKPVDFTGWCCLDDLVLAAEGVTDFDKYAVTPGAKLQLDFFFPHDAPAPHEANGMVGWRWPHL